MNIPIYITKSNINLHINKQKSLAIFHLNQMLKYQLSQLIPKLTIDQQQIVNFYAHHIYDKEIIPITDNSVSSLIHQYPFLQPFAPKINPKITLDINQEMLTISCLNIDGGAKTKLTNDHPYIYNIIRSHNPHIMAFLDTRLQDAPDFNIPGYELVAYSTGDDNTYHHIGGVLVYKRIDLLQEIKIVRINNDTDTIIISITVQGVSHYMTFAYVDHISV